MINKNKIFMSINKLKFLKKFYEGFHQKVSNLSEYLLSEVDRGKNFRISNIKPLEIKKKIYKTENIFSIETNTISLLLNLGI